LLLSRRGSRPTRRSGARAAGSRESRAAATTEAPVQGLAGDSSTWPIQVAAAPGAVAADLSDRVL